MSQPYPQNQKVKNNKELHRDLHKAAMLFEKYADHKVLFIYSAGKTSVPEAYEVYYGRENFMHLAGYKVKPDAGAYASAKRFFEICIEGMEDSFEKNRQYYMPTDSRKETSAKLDALPALLDYGHVRLYKMGPKGAATVDNNFDIGIGTSREILGFSRRNFPFPVPVTAMHRPLGDYVFEQHNVIAVLLKGRYDDFYSEVAGCIASGIIREELPEDIRNRISKEVEVLRCVRK